MKKQITSLLVCLVLILSNHKINGQLVNPNAISEAKSLYAFMNEIYGQKILSGQVNQSWLNLIKNKTGKQPAILGLDFDGICPSQNGNNGAEVAIDYVLNKGGIVQFQWHWISPDANGDYYTDNFNLGQALSNPNGSSYKNMLRDIDLVAAEIKKMQEAGVPIIWRPVHEAEGAWFWWGKSGKEALIQLYRLIYDRFTNHHNLNNIIWIWNSYGTEKGNWYPGDDVCDIIAWDYENNSSWSQFQSLFGNKGKLFGLAEVGNLPDPNNFSSRHWSFFLCWDYMIQDPSEPNIDPYGRSGENSTSWTQTVYNDYRTLNLSDLEHYNVYGRYSGIFANAGPDQDIELNGGITIPVYLDGSGSVDNEGTISSYEWTSSLGETYTGAKPTINLGFGEHMFILKVTSTSGKISTDTVFIQIAYPNIALNKPVTVSSTEADYGNIAPNATDGDTTTRWSSQYSDPQWIIVDLEDVYNINKISIKWEAAYASNYFIEASNDNLGWTEVATSSSGNGDWDFHDITAQNIRFVRINCISRATQWGNSIYEIKIHGVTTENDTQAPTVPTNLLSTNQTSESITLSWNASSDNVGVSGYKIYIDGNYTTTVTGTSFSASSLLPNKSYSFRVSAIDAAGNESELSSAISESTLNQALNIALNKPVVASSTETGNNVGNNVVDGNPATRWSSSYNDPQWIYVDLENIYNIEKITLLWEAAYAVSYKIEVSSDLNNWTAIANITNGNGNVDNIETSIQGVRYVRVYGTERATQWGYSLFEIEVYGSLGESDTEKPSAPSNLRSTGKTETSISLSWNSSNDNIGVTNYKIHNIGYGHTNETGTSAVISGLTPNTAYQFVVIAADAAGNESEPSDTITITTSSQSINIALNKPVFVSSTEDGNNIATNAVDGSVSTRWSSEYSDPQWFYVDLQNLYAISKVVLNWEAAYGKSYEIQISNDAQAWNSIHFNPNSDGGIDNILVNVVARYIRINITQRATEWGCSLWEFEVYGTQSTDNIPPVADAGQNKTVTDIGGDGKETIKLNGANSYDSDGSIVRYLWTKDGEVVSSEVSPSVTLYIGTHDFILSVEDNDGAIHSAYVSITIASDNGTISFTGISTHFEAFGTPYGGCGVPEDLLETPNYVALNVYNTPGSYEMYDRPIKGSDMQYIGEFNNGYNCGRWVEVTIGPDCDGFNDGQAGEEFCRGENAQWVDDEYSGAKLYMLVGDACGDPNAWCRDSEFHLDLATHALNIFEKDGETIDDMYPLHFNNRKITWNYVKAPNYAGDIKIYFMQNAQQYWPAILINHLENGIHSVEQKVGNTWVVAERNSDMGQAFILPNSTPPYRIRITDADDQYINNGREYIFDFPASCNGNCTAPATEVFYTTENDGLKSSHGFESAGLNSHQETTGSLFIHAEIISGNVFLKWKGAFEGKSQIVVVDNTGRILKKSDFYSKTTSDSFGLGYYKSGFYVVTFINNNQQVRRIKLIIP